MWVIKTMVEDLVTYCRPVLRKQQLEKEDFRDFSLLSVFLLLRGFRCKKSGYFTKPVKNITNRIFICHKQVNNYTKSNSYSLKRQQNYFCNRTVILIFTSSLSMMCIIVNRVQIMSIK